MKNPTRVLFIIRSLDTGGTERQLVELVKGLDKTRYRATVAVFYAGGALFPLLEGLDGVRLVCLHKRGRWDTFGFVWRLLKLVRGIRPQIVHGYLGVANLYGLLAARVAGPRAVWGLRSSALDYSAYDRGTRSVFRIGAWLSPLADLIIVNSQAGRDYHRAQGYAARRMRVIPNGIDTGYFRPDPAGGRGRRADWSVAPDETLVGIVGRIDPLKGHPFFFRAAAQLTDRLPRLRLVCAGDGPRDYVDEMRALAASLGLTDRLIWAGDRQDMPAVYNALDLLCSASSSEGFSNVIAEAMACGIPCVVTDVGDSRQIVGETGRVVPPDDPDALARAWLEMLTLTAEARATLAQAVRERVVRSFSLERMLSATEAAFDELLSP